jgi:hypothetical protein
MRDQTSRLGTRAARDEVLWSEAMALRNSLDLKDECRPRRRETGRLRRFDGTARTRLKIAQCAMQLFN